MNTRLIASWLLQVIVVAILAPMVYMKFTAAPDTVRLFQSLEMEPTGRFLIGGLELAVIILLLIPHSVAWGAILGWGVMSGAILAHLSRLGISGDMGPVFAMALTNWLACAVILILRRRQIEFIRNMFPNEQQPPN